MLVLYICYDGILDNLGQTQVLPYIFGLNDKGFNFIIFSFERHDRTKEEFKKQKQILKTRGIKWYHLNFYPKKYNRFLRLILGPIKLNYIIRKNKINFAHIRSINAGTVYLLSLIKLPFIYDMRCFAGQLGDYGLIKNKWILKIFLIFEKLLINKSKGIVVLDKSGEDYLQKYSKNKIPLQVIPTATNIKKFEKNKVDINKEEIKFVLLGGAQFPYLPERALDFIKFLSKNQVKCTLDIINQRHHEYIKKIVREVNFPEELLKVFALNPNDIFNKLPHYDCGLVFIESGDWIRMSSPTKIGEYLAAGLHVVGLEGIEILERLSMETKSVDILPRYKDFDFNKISVIIRKIKSNNRKRESIAIAKKYYDLETAVSKYLKLYNNFL